MNPLFSLLCFFLLGNKTETQAQAQQQNHSTPLTEASGEILNNTGNLELQQATRHLTCNLRNMQLKKIKRAEKKGTESVMDEKFALLFQSKFQTGDMQLNVCANSPSLNLTIKSIVVVMFENIFRIF